MKSSIPCPTINERVCIENECKQNEQTVNSKIQSKGKINCQKICIRNENMSNNKKEQKDDIKNDKTNVCLQLFNTFDHNDQNINPKFFDSMLKLLEQYHVSFNISVQDPEKNESSSIDVDSNKQLEKDQNTKKTSYKKFTEKEDILLKNIVNLFGAKNWRMIASMIPNKTARQCRDRYTNYLAPGYIHSEWTDDEDILLFQKYVEFGPQWTKIQKFFPNRTANSIKNRYNYTVCKKQNNLDPNEQSIDDLNDDNLGSNGIENEMLNYENTNDFQENSNNDLNDYFYEDLCFNMNVENNENDCNIEILDI